MARIKTMPGCSRISFAWRLVAAGLWLGAFRKREFWSSFIINTETSRGRKNTWEPLLWLCENEDFDVFCQKALTSRGRRLPFTCTPVKYLLNTARMKRFVLHYKEYYYIIIRILDELLRLVIVMAVTRWHIWPGSGKISDSVKYISVR